jgi:hypothetical protein
MARASRRRAGPASVVGGRRAVTLLVAVGVAAIAACVAAARPGAHSRFAPTRTLDVDVAVDGLAANGSRAAFLWGGYSVDVWDVRTGVRREVGGSDSGISDLSITDDVVGYLAFEDTISAHYRTVETRRLVSGRLGFELVADLLCARTCVGHVVGHGNLLVYNSWQNSPAGNTKAVLWRITGKRARPVIRGNGALFAAAVDRGRVVLRNQPRAARLVSEVGSVLAHYRFAHPVRTVRLGGDDLAALLPRAVVVLDARTGALKRSWKVAKRARLEDVAGGLVLYIVGGQIHVRRLADGRDRAVPLPDNAQGPLHAQLEPSGLFYSWTLPLAPGEVLPEGRLAFAPMSRVAALF